MLLKKLKNKISALTALILLCLSTESRAALNLTETIYTIPEGELSASFHEEAIRLDDNYRKENWSLGIGVLPYLSVWYSFDYLHKGIIDSGGSTLGDSFLKIWLYLGDYKSIHTGLLLNFRLPTGPDAYSNSTWRNLSFGNNELKIGPVSKIDISKSIFLHMNIFYVFRQEEGEDFYNGFHFNILKKETYTNVFGLNFKSEDAFLSTGRLKNDYIICSMAFNTDIIYPLIPYVEFYASHNVYKNNSGENAKIQIEGAGINPVLTAAGGRYFFSESAYAGLYYIYNPRREKKFIKDIFGFDFSLQF